METVIYFQSAYCESNDAEVHGVQRWAQQAKWNVRVIPYAEAAASRLQSRVDRMKPPPIAKLIDFWHPIGAIVDCGAAVGLLKPSDFGWLPVVFLDSPAIKGGVCVRSDSRAIGESAARELLSLGFSTYAYVPWFRQMAWSRERGKAFAEIVQMNGCAFHAFDWRKAKSDVEMRRRLSVWLEAVPRPVGVFAANDYVASLVESCAIALKIRIPEDVAILGVDNDVRICTYARPTLSSVNPDFEVAGWCAASLLDQMIRNPELRPSDAFFGVESIVRRESTRIRPHHDDRIESVLTLIRNSAHEGLTPAGIAKQIGCSRRLLELRFKEMTGSTLLKEIRSVRIELARRLLTRSSLSYEEVSQQCGYTSVVTFRRAFMTETGISPRECRMRSCRVDVRFCSNMRTDGACDLSSEERTVRSDG